MRILTLLLLVTVAGAAHAGPAQSPTLESLLGAEEFRAMGLDKLSEAERERLLRWVLRTREARVVPFGTPTVSFGVGAASRDAPAPVQPAENSAGPVVSVTTRAEARVPVEPAAAAVTPQAEATLFGIEQTDQGVQEIRARIVGEFTGWEGKTEFVLDNGQVWRQSTSGTYKHRATAPEVVITRALVGYKLRLVETRRSINVRRVK